MKALRPFVRPVLLVLTALLVVGALGFVERTADRRPIQDLAIDVRAADDARFITTQQVREAVLGMGDGVVGVPVAETDLDAIEARLRSIPWVGAAEAYHTLDGVLHVRVDQRLPIVRVIEPAGVGYYIDADGHTMPLSEQHTARVPVAMGAITLPGAAERVIDLRSPDSLITASRLPGVHRIAGHVRKDPFWSAMVDQIVVTPEGEYELIPRVGGQRIRIGGADRLEQRLAKLNIFYRQGVEQTDWRRHSIIDLRFDGQVVCTKRTTP